MTAMFFAFRAVEYKHEANVEARKEGEEKEEIAKIWNKLDTKIFNFFRTRNNFSYKSF